jgi:small subunit ribosomal protein S16
MSVRVRLTRVGSRKNPIWRVVVADQRSPRDGRFIETIGHYNPQTEPSTIAIDEERLQHWLARGAQPTGTVKQLIKAHAKGGAAAAESVADEPQPEAELVPETAAEATAAAAAGPEEAAALEPAAEAAAPEPTGEPAAPQPAAEPAAPEPAAEAPQPQPVPADAGEGEPEPAPPGEPAPGAAEQIEADPEAAPAERGDSAPAERGDSAPGERGDSA